MAVGCGGWVLVVEDDDVRRRTPPPHTHTYKTRLETLHGPGGLVHLKVEAVALEGLQVLHDDQLLHRRELEGPRGDEALLVDGRGGLPLRGWVGGGE